MHGCHCQSHQHVHAHDEAEALGQNLRRGVGETLQVLNAGSQVLRALLHGVIWNEWGMSSSPGWGQTPGCHRAVHHYHIHCHPTPCPCRCCV